MVWSGWSVDPHEDTETMRILKQGVRARMEKRARKQYIVEFTTNIFKEGSTRNWWETGKQVAGQLPLSPDGREAVGLRFLAALGSCRNPQSGKGSTPSIAATRFPLTALDLLRHNCAVRALQSIRKSWRAPYRRGARLRSAPGSNIYISERGPRYAYLYK